MEISQLLPNTLHLLIVIIHFDLAILVVCVAAHTNSSIHVEGPDLLPSDESSDVSLDLHEQR